MPSESSDIDSTVVPDPEMLIGSGGGSVDVGSGLGGGVGAGVGWGSGVEAGAGGCVGIEDAVKDSVVGGGAEVSPPPQLNTKNAERITTRLTTILNVKPLWQRLDCLSVIRRPALAAGGTGLDPVYLVL
jgi:hypothetical protein